MPVSPGCLCRFLKKFLPSAEDFLELFSTPTGLDWCVLLGIIGAFILESNDLSIGQTEPTSSKRERENRARPAAQCCGVTGVYSYTPATYSSNITHMVIIKPLNEIF